MPSSKHRLKSASIQQALVEPSVECLDTPGSHRSISEKTAHDPDLAGAAGQTCCFTLRTLINASLVNLMARRALAEASLQKTCTPRAPIEASLRSVHTHRHRRGTLINACLAVAPKPRALVDPFLHTVLTSPGPYRSISTNPAHDPAFRQNVASNTATTGYHRSISACSYVWLSWRHLFGLKCQ